MQNIPAHYDGVHVLLDEHVDLPPNARLVVTVLPDMDSERADFLLLSTSALADAYSDEEVEYSAADIVK